jgi:hypothetical protein
MKIIKKINLASEMYPQLVGKLEQLSFLSKNLQKLVALTQANLNFVAPRQNIGNP